MRDNMIIHKSEQLKHDNFLKWASVTIVDCKPTDNLILEDWHIKIYEHSKQWDEDSNKYHLTKENAILKKKNNDLVRIANNKVRKEMELDTKWQEADEYQRKLYLLRNMKNAYAKESME